MVRVAATVLVAMTDLLFFFSGQGEDPYDNPYMIWVNIGIIIITCVNVGIMENQLENNMEIKWNWAYHEIRISTYWSLGHSPTLL